LVLDYNLIEKELLDDICNFLEPFQEVLDALSEDQQPSLHRVIPLRQYLMNKCEVKEEDSAAIIRLEVFLSKKKNHVKYFSSWYLKSFKVLLNMFFLLLYLFL